MTSSKLKKVLDQTKHRPYPLSKEPWVLRMRWHGLLFMHWPVPKGWLRPLVPPGLELDTFDGSAWLDVTLFRIERTRPRFLPTMLRLSSFPELNVRTYVIAEGKPGIWFFSLDASNPVAVRLARATYALPYFDAKMSCRSSRDKAQYRSVHTIKAHHPQDSQLATARLASPSRLAPVRWRTSSPSAIVCTARTKKDASGAGTSTTGCGPCRSQRQRWKS
jgi:uncharacterized protein YqjF (DUF2071 family)